MSNDEFMELPEMMADIKRAADSIRKSTYLDAKKASLDYVIPLIEMIAENFDARMTDSEAALAEIIEGGESIIQPDLAAQIAGTLEIGLQLAAVVDSLQVEGDQAQAVKDLVAAYRAAHAQTLAAVAEAALESAGDEDGAEVMDDALEDDEDGDDEDDEDEDDESLNEKKAG